MHLNIIECPSCNIKLNGAHEAIKDWFLWVKARHLDAHISWAYRGEEDQNAMFNQGKSKLIWPKSAHNYEDNGKPCACALDLFRIDDEGHAQFDSVWCEQIYDETMAANYPISWGGHFKTLGDASHYQLRNDS